MNESELIDTLWNVNYNVKEYFMGEEHELIDTLWNVNADLRQPTGL